MKKHDTLSSAEEARLMLENKRVIGERAVYWLRKFGPNDDTDTGEHYTASMVARLLREEVRRGKPTSGIAAARMLGSLDALLEIARRLSMKHWDEFVKDVMAAEKGE